MICLDYTLLNRDCQGNRNCTWQFGITYGIIKTLALNISASVLSYCTRTCLCTNQQQHLSLPPQQHIRMYNKIMSLQSQPFLQPQSQPPCPPQQLQSNNSMSISQHPPPLNIVHSSFNEVYSIAVASARVRGYAYARKVFLWYDKRLSTISVWKFRRCVIKSLRIFFVCGKL